MMIMMIGKGISKEGLYKKKGATGEDGKERQDGKGKSDRQRQATKGEETDVRDKERSTKERTPSR